MAAPSSILDWRTPWTEEPGSLQSLGSQVRHDLATKPQPPWLLFSSYVIKHMSLKLLVPIYKMRDLDNWLQNPFTFLASGDSRKEWCPAVARLAQIGPWDAGDDWASCGCEHMKLCWGPQDSGGRPKRASESCQGIAQTVETHSFYFILGFGCHFFAEET